MTRGERLLALVAELRRSSGPVPAAELARRVRVSASTVRRDLGVLARAGLPLRFERGQGYAVDQPPRRPVPPPLASLVAPVPETLADAVRARRVVRVDYRGASGRRTRRDVEAHGLVTSPYGQYLMGWCRTRQGPRLFRVDRVAAASLTDHPAPLRELEDLLARVRVPRPRPPADDTAPSGQEERAPRDPGRARTWTLDRLRDARRRLGDLTGALRSGGEGAAAARVVLGHLAEWTRWQVAAVRAVATGGDLVFDGDRPPFPAAFEGDVPFPERERMIQDAMAPRSLAEIAADLDLVLEAAARWAAGCGPDLWSGTIPDPAAPPARRPLADLLAGPSSPLAHVTWHLDHLPEPAPQITHCPLTR
ncbi:MAG TPA: WYL domain-containing protein [Thermomonospora sp.]|nr:WYL domain-containing protein [Thermomonospora sp.]